MRELGYTVHMKNPCVLIVEDHKELAETIGENLQFAGFEVDYAMDGVTGLHLAVTNRYDALVLDIMLPGMDGFQLCEKLRQDAHSDVPVLMLTARDSQQDKLQGFRKGSDDYLVKPFDPEELIARLQSLIRRYRGELDNRLLVVGDLEFDQDALRVTREGELLKVSPTGMEILKVLMKKPGIVISKEALSEALWGEGAPDSDALRSHLYLLRKAIDKPFETALLHTVPGMGVKLEAPQ